MVSYLLLDKMSSYPYYVNDPTNINIKVTTLTQRISIDPEIGPSLLGVVYTAPNVIATFSLPLSDKESRILTTMYMAVIDNIVAGVNYLYNNYVYVPRNVNSWTSVVTNQYDIYSGYNVGLMIFDASNESFQICFDATPNSAVWSTYFGGTGATGGTGSTGQDGKTGDTGATGPTVTELCNPTAEIYACGDGTTTYAVTLTLAKTFYEIAPNEATGSTGATSLTSNNSKFTLPYFQIGGNCRLQYIGTPTEYFHVFMNASYNTSGSNRNLWFQLYKME